MGRDEDFRALCFCISMFLFVSSILPSISLIHECIDNAPVRNCLFHFFRPLPSYPPLTPPPLLPPNPPHPFSPQLPARSSLTSIHHPRSSPPSHFSPLRNSFIFFLFFAIFFPLHLFSLYSLLSLPPLHPLSSLPPSFPPIPPDIHSQNANSTRNMPKISASAG